MALFPSAVKYQALINKQALRTGIKHVLCRGEKIFQKIQRMVS